MYHNRQNYLSFWANFCPFTPNKLENQNFEKMKTTSGDIVILQTNTIKDSHKWKLYDVWFLRYWAWQTEFFLILDNFLPFYSPSLTTQRIKILKKWKKQLEISSFYTSLLYMTIIWYMVPGIWGTTDIIFYHLGPFFALLPP